MYLWCIEEILTSRRGITLVRRRCSVVPSEGDKCKGLTSDTKLDRSKKLCISNFANRFLCQVWLVSVSTSGAHVVVETVLGGERDSRAPWRSIPLPPHPRSCKGLKVVSLAIRKQKVVMNMSLSLAFFYWLPAHPHTQVHWLETDRWTLV